MSSSDEEIRCPLTYKNFVFDQSYQCVKLPNHKQPCVIINGDGHLERKEKRTARSKDDASPKVSTLPPAVRDYLYRRREVV